MKDRHGNEWVLVPEVATPDMHAAITFGEGYAAAIAAAPKFEAPEVDDAMADRVHRNYFLAPGVTSGAELGHQMIAAVRTELGPTLGLVEIREPTPEECERISRYCRGYPMADESAIGRAMFNAVRAVMWPKSEVQS